MYALVNIKVNNKVVENASHLCISRRDLCKIKYFSKNENNIFIEKDEEVYNLKDFSFILMSTNNFDEILEYKFAEFNYLVNTHQIFGFSEFPMFPMSNYFIFNKSNLIFFMRNIKFIFSVYDSVSIIYLHRFCWDISCILDYHFEGNHIIIESHESSSIIGKFIGNKDKFTTELLMQQLIN